MLQEVIVAIDGVFSLGEFTRLHADVSFGDGLGIVMLFGIFCIVY